MPLKYIIVMDITQIQYKNVAVLSRKLTAQKSGSSNLLEKIAKSVVAFRINVSVLTSREAMPKRRTCVKCKLL